MNVRSNETEYYVHVDCDRSYVESKICSYKYSSPFFQLKTGSVGLKDIDSLTVMCHVM